MSRRDKSAGAPAVQAPSVQPDAPEVSTETAPVEPAASVEAPLAVDAPPLPTEAEGLLLPADGEEREAALDAAPVVKAVDASVTQEAAREPEAACEKCKALNGTRPCSLECWVKAGYAADRYDAMWGLGGTGWGEAPPVAEAPKRKAAAAGHTLCKVVNTDIFYRSNLIAEGTIAEFDDGTVLAMPTVLVPVE